MRSDCDERAALPRIDTIEIRYAGVVQREHSAIALVDDELADGVAKR